MRYGSVLFPKRTYSTCLLLAIVFILAGNEVQAEADFGVSAIFGFGGEQEIDVTINDPGGAEYFSSKHNFTTTFGFNLFAHFNIVKALQIGGEARLLFWAAEYPSNASSEYGSYMIEVGPSFRTVVKVISEMSFFLRFMPGLAIVVRSDELGRELIGEPGVKGLEFHTAIGLTLGGFGGMSFEFSEHLGAMIEFGYIYHLAYGEWDNTWPTSYAKGDYEFSGGQFTLSCGVYF